MHKCNVVEAVETTKEQWCFDVYNHETMEHKIFATDTQAEKTRVFFPLPIHVLVLCTLASSPLQWMEALKREQGPLVPPPSPHTVDG